MLRWSGEFSTQPFPQLVGEVRWNAKNMLSLSQHGTRLARLGRGVWLRGGLAAHVVVADGLSLADHHRRDLGAAAGADVVVDREGGVQPPVRPGHAALSSQVVLGAELELLHLAAELEGAADRRRRLGDAAEADAWNTRCKQRTQPSRESRLAFASRRVRKHSREKSSASWPCTHPRSGPSTR